MRPGSFMYCEEQKEHLCIFCNTAFSHASEATPPPFPCKYVSYTPGGGFALFWLLFFFLNGIPVLLLIVFFYWLREGRNKESPPQKCVASNYGMLKAWGILHFLTQTSLCAKGSTVESPVPLKDTKKT